MNIVLLSGGLGNQMFQYAFYLSLKKKMEKTYLNDYLICRGNPHNGFELPLIFGLTIRISFFYSLLIRLMRKMTITNGILSSFMFWLLSAFNICFVKEIGDACYKDEYLCLRRGLNLFWGYWQSEKYFDKIDNIVRATYQFDLHLLSSRSRDFIVKLQDVNSVSLHVRRGDYLTSEVLSIYGNICTFHYYEKAICHIMRDVSKPYFFVFSDDVDWVKQNMNIPNATFIDWNKGKDSWQDMCLMSNCKHNIIANSSFSWWGAWLNDNPDKIVVAPSRFLNNSNTPDILPDEWIKIPV